MFKAWLRNCPQASYRQLVQALVELGDVSEADNLCRKYGEPCNNYVQCDLVLERNVEASYVQRFKFLLFSLLLRD